MGSPGDHADRVHTVGLQVEGVDRDGGQHYDDEDARDLGEQLIEQQDADGDRTPRTAAVAFASPCASPDTKARASATSPSASTGEPRSSGELW